MSILNFKEYLIEYCSSLQNFYQMISHKQYVKMQLPIIMALEEIESNETQ